MRFEGPMSPTLNASIEIRFCAKNTQLRTRAVEILGAKSPRRSGRAAGDLTIGAQKSPNLSGNLTPVDSPFSKKPGNRGFRAAEMSENLTPVDGG
jgi:hypothetical protein